MAFVCCLSEKSLGRHSPRLLPPRWLALPPRCTPPPMVLSICWGQARTCFISEIVQNCDWPYIVRSCQTMKRLGVAPPINPGIWLMATCEQARRNHTLRKVSARVFMKSTAAIHRQEWRERSATQAGQGGSSVASGHRSYRPWQPVSITSTPTGANALNVSSVQRESACSFSPVHKRNGGVCGRGGREGSGFRPCVLFLVMQIVCFSGFVCTTPAPTPQSVFAVELL